MAIGAKDVILHLGADARDLEHALDGAEAKVKSFAERVKKKIDTTAFKAVGVAVTGIGVAIGGLLVTTGLYAARVEVLKTSMEVVGETAGYTTKYLAEQEEKIKDLGITTKSAREILILLMQSEIDLAEATDLCRTAQDLAVISGENSSETARNLAYAIATGNPELLRRYGIMENLSDIQKKYGRDLTGVEKKEAILNMIRKKGATVAGVYEKAMGDVGKQLTSLPRLIDDAKLAFGQAFIPVIGKAVEILSKLLKMFTDLSPETKTMITHIVMFAAGLALVVGPVLTLIGFLPAIIAGFGVLLGPVGLVTAAVTALAAAIGVLVWKHWDEIKAKVDETVQAVVSRFGEWDNVIGYFRKFIKDKVIPTVEKFMEKGKELAFKLVEVGVKIYNKFSDVLPSLVGLIETVVGWFEKFWDKGGELADKLAEAGKKIGDKFIDMLPDLVDTIEDSVIPAFENLAEKIGPMIEKGIEFMGLLAETAIDWLPKIVDKIGDLIEWLAKLDPRWLEIILGIIGFAVALKAASIIIGKVSAIFVKLWGIIKWLLKPILFIIGLWGKLGAIINWIIGIGKSLYLALLAIPEPITKIIALIIILIGIGILLWKNWDKIKDFLVETWDKIKIEAIKTWENIKTNAIRIWENTRTEAIKTWNSIRDYFANLWESIKIKAAETWESTKIKIIEVWNSVKDYFVELWESIKTDTIEGWKGIEQFFIDTWEGIKNTFKEKGEDIWAWMLDWIPFLNLIVTEWGPTIIELFGDIWEEIKTEAAEIWNSTRDFLAETWESIKAEATEMWNSIRDFFVETWNTIKEKVIEIWTAISDFFRDTWDIIYGYFELGIITIRDYLVEQFEIIKIQIMEIWNSIKEFFMLLWEDIKIKIFEIWTSIKEFFVGIWEGIKADFTFALEFVKNLISTAFYFIKDEVIIPIWNSIVDFFGNIWDQIIIAVNTFKDNFLKVWDYIKEGLKNPINAMIGLINSFLGRIESGMNSMISALNRIGFKVPDWLAEIMPGLAGREFKISIGKISIPRIPKLQLGGLVTGAGFADIGERGVERVFLPRGAQVVPLEASAAGIINYYFYISRLVVREEADIRRIAQQLESIRILGARARGIKE